MNTEVPETPPVAEVIAEAASPETVIEAKKPEKVRADVKLRHPTDEKFVAMLGLAGLKDPEDFRYSDGKCRIKRAGMEKMIAGVAALDARADGAA